MDKKQEPGIKLELQELYPLLCPKCRQELERLLGEKVAKGLVKR